MSIAMGWTVIYLMIIIILQPLVRYSDDVMNKLVLCELFLMFLASHVLEDIGNSHTPNCKSIIHCYLLLFANILNIYNILISNVLCVC
jgi:hypothetical protein